MTPLRFTHHEVRYEPARVRAALSQTIDLLRHRTRLQAHPAVSKIGRAS